MSPRRRRRTLAHASLRAGQYALLTIVCLAVLFPLYWMAASSLKTPEQLATLPPLWVPPDPSLDAYGRVFEVVPFARTFLNSVVIAGGTTIAILVTSLMAGYAFARYRFRGRNLLFGGVVSTMFVPPIVLLVPLFRMMQGLGLVDTYAGAMLPFLANAFGIFLMRQFIAGVPDELLEAARVDGASEWTILWRIVAPLVRPAIAALALFAFVFHWNSFIWPLTVLQSQEMHTVVLSLNRLVSYTSSVEFSNVVMAGATISVLPNLLLFVLLQRTFVRSIATTGVTG